MNINVKGASSSERCNDNLDIVRNIECLALPSSVYNHSAAVRVWIEFDFNRADKIAGAAESRRRCLTINHTMKFSSTSIRIRSKPTCSYLFTNYISGHPSRNDKHKEPQARTLCKWHTVMNSIT